MSLAETKTTAKKKAAQKRAVTLKVSLRGSRPPIWRRLIVPGSATLADLHVAIQAAMGWEDSHLHHFDVDGRHYGDRSILDEVADERRLTLNGLLNTAAQRFSYTYDFGDDWEHIITIEKVAYTDTAPSGPICIAGKRACPPEDCGGIWGYYHLLEVLADPNHPEYKDQKEWVDDNFDPEAFDLGYANVTLGGHIS